MTPTKKIFSVFLFLITSGIFAQNLVVNGGFDDHSACPNNLSSLCGDPNGQGDQLAKAPPWYIPTCGSADLFDVCGSVGPGVSVPDNYPGFQFPRNGNGYAGFYAYSQTTEASLAYKIYREYMQQSLSRPLVIGKTYCASFWVSRGENCQYAIKEIGMLLTTSAVLNKNASYQENLPFIPQVVNTAGVITDTINWVEISRTFVADSAYGFITIGNFKGRNQNTVQNVPKYGATGTAYYFVEDVTLYEVPEVNLGSDIVFDCDGAFSYTLNAQNPGNSYLWSTGETTQTINIDSVGKYSVKVYGGKCEAVDTIAVSCTSSNPPIYFPSCFSPNEDGTNEVFAPVTNLIGDFKIEIYNRWGEMIHSSVSINEGWNGKIRNTTQNAKEDVYIYTVTLATTGSNAELISKKGHVVLIR